MMIEAVTIRFQDAESAHKAVVIVRFDEDHVALCLSLEHDGDVEAVMSKEDARNLVKALVRAVS
jgi:hypothetical protein